jgi:hypothetical protein
MAGTLPFKNLKYSPIFGLGFVRVIARFTFAAECKRFAWSLVTAIVSHRTILSCLLHDSIHNSNKKNEKAAKAGHM